MGDRHGGRFARRGRALSPPRRGFPMARCGVPMARGGGQDLPARERSPRQKPPETAHGRKDLSRAGTRPSAKAARHGARAKGFAPRRNTPHGEGLPTRRTSERICPAQELAPRRRHPDTAHGRRDLPRAGTRPSAKASRHGARAKGFAPRGSRSPHVPTNGGPPSTDGQPKNTLRRGRTHSACGRCRVHSPKKIRLLHETQLFYGESHVGSRQIFPSFPSVGRCVARERNPVPPFVPHRGKGHRGLRRDGEMHHGFGEMVRRFGECPRGGNAWLPHGGRYCPGLRSFGERFHLRRCANPDAYGGPRCSRG